MSKQLKSKILLIGGDTTMDFNTDSFKKAQTTTTINSKISENQTYLYDLITKATEYSINNNQPLFYLHQLKAIIRNEVIRKQNEIKTLKEKKTLSDSDKKRISELTLEGINPLNIDINDKRIPQVREQIYSLANKNTNIKRKIAYKGTKQKIVIIYNNEILEKYAKTNAHAKTLLEQVSKLPTLQ